MAVDTSAGTLLHIAIAKPTTFDATGYAALTWVPVGEIVDPGEFGRKYALIKHNPVATRGTQKFKGSFDEGVMNLKMALDPSDAGQIVMIAAAVADQSYSFKVTLPNGQKYYSQAMVMDFVVGGLTVDSVTSAAASLELTTTKTGVGIVMVAAV